MKRTRKLRLTKETLQNLTASDLRPVAGASEHEVGTSNNSCVSCNSCASCNSCVSCNSCATCNTIPVVTAF